MKDENNDDYFEKQSPSTLRSIGGLLTFSTILPLNIYTTIDEMARLTWFWPVLNGLIGLLATIIAFILAKFIHFDPFLIAAIVGLDTRATMDMDATIKGLPVNEQTVREMFEEICKIELLP